MITSDRVFNKAMVTGENYSCNLVGRDMRKMMSLSVTGTDVPDDAGDVEEEWFNGTCLMYVAAIEEHLKIMSELCSEAR